MKLNELLIKIKWKGIVIWLILALTTILVGAIFQDEIVNWTKSHILNEEPYPTIAITKIYRIDNPNFLNLSEKHKKEIGSIEFQSYLLETGVLGKDRSINIRTDTGEAYFVENSTWIKGITHPNYYINDKREIYQSNCILAFFSHLNKDSNPKNKELTWEIKWPVKRKEGTQNLTEFSILINNKGNEVIKDIYLKFCPDNGLLISADNGEIEGECLTAEIPYLYPEQRKDYIMYISGQNIDTITLHSDMNNRNIPNYVTNQIMAIYANSTCDRQDKVIMRQNEFDLRLEDLKLKEE